MSGHGLMQAFVRITGYIPQKLVFRTKVYYEDKAAQGRCIKGPAIIISNHTAIFDYAAFLFVFWSRTLRYQMAEVLFRRNGFMNIFLKLMGGIYVDRDAHDFSFMGRSQEILEKGGVVGIFPESRLPRKDETPLLPFKPSAAYIALSGDWPVIPVYTNGCYFNSKRARVIIGKPFYAADLAEPGLPEKENLEAVSGKMREIVTELGKELERQIQK